VTFIVVIFISCILHRIKPSNITVTDKTSHIVIRDLQSFEIRFKLESAIQIQFDSKVITVHCTLHPSTAPQYCCHTRTEIQQQFVWQWGRTMV